MKRILLLLGNTVLPVVLVVFAVGYTRSLISGREAPAARSGPREAALVTVWDPQPVQHAPTIEAHGIVVPAREVVVQTEVSGRIEWMHPALQVGGLISEGDELVRIDVRDYRLAVREAESALEQAQTQLTLEQGRQSLAQAEWQAYAQLAGSVGDDALATRQPQLRSAELAVDAAQIRLDRARLNLSRTTVRAPMDAIVIAESAEVGMLASAQTQIARLVGTDAYWVELSVPFDQIAQIALTTDAGPGAGVALRPGAGAASGVREGRVLRLLGQIDADARMARLLVEVTDPLLLAPASEPAGTPLLLGAYVAASIDGGAPVDAVRLPREALRAGGTLWVMTAESTLDVLPYTVLAVDEQTDTAVVNTLLRPGDRVVRSHLASPATGMSLRLAGEADAAAAAGAAEGSR